MRDAGCVKLDTSPLNPLRRVSRTGYRRRGGLSLGDPGTQGGAAAVLTVGDHFLAAAGLQFEAPKVGCCAL